MRCDENLLSLRCFFQRKMKMLNQIETIKTDADAEMLTYFNTTEEKFQGKEIFVKAKLMLM